MVEERVLSRFRGHLLRRRSSTVVSVARLESSGCCCGGDGGGSYSCGNWAMLLPSRVFHALHDPAEPYIGDLRGEMIGEATVTLAAVTTTMVCTNTIPINVVSTTMVWEGGGGDSELGRRYGMSADGSADMTWVDRVKKKPEDSRVEVACGSSKPSVRQGQLTIILAKLTDEGVPATRDAPS